MTMVATDDRATAAWHEFDQKATKQEQPYETHALAQFAAEATAVVRLIESSVPDFKAERDPLNEAFVWPYLEAAVLKIAAAYSSAGSFYRQWYNRFRPLVAKTVQVGASGERVGFTLTVRQNLQFQEIIQRRVTKLAGNVTETTLQQIRDVMAQARTEGVGVREVAKRIRTDVFGDSISKARATTIARTETVGALNEGEWLKATRGGVMRSKKWVSQRVGNARPRHIAEENAGWVPIDAPYTVTGKMYPHDGIGGAKEDVNCRCSQLFSDLTADEANGGGS